MRIYFKLQFKKKSLHLAHIFIQFGKLYPIKIGASMLIIIVKLNTLMFLFVDSSEII